MTDEAEPPRHLEVTVSGGNAYVAGRDLHLTTAEAAVRPPRGRDDACPYPGLEPFDAASATWFHGRERAVTDLCRRLDDRLRTGGPLVVLGPSGAGKSSLLAAGVLPAIADGALPARGSTRWRRVLLTPTAHPAAALAAALGAPPPHGGPAAYAAAVFDAVRGTGLVLVVDQFEEVFTLGADEAERRRFVEVLDLLARPPDRNVLVVLGVRADFYARCAADDRLRDALRADPVLLDPLTDEELEQAIRRPAAAAGLTIRDGLVDLLLADLAGPDRTGTLPLLAHALRATWQEREDGALTPAAYRRTGGIHDAVARTAESAYAALAPEGRAAARAVFLRLVVIGRDTEDTRRHVAPDDLLRGLPDERAARSVVDTFTARRLLLRERETVVVVHEALIREWPRLREWIDRDRPGQLLRQELDQAAAGWERSQDQSALYRGARLEAASDWAAAHPDELTATARAFLTAAARQRQRSRRNRRAAVAVVTALAVLATAAAGFALVQRDRARASAATAVTNQISSLAAQLAPTDPALAAQLALVAHRREQTDDTASRLIGFENTPVPSRLGGPESGTRAMALSPDGHTLATYDTTGALRLWDVRDPHRATEAGRLDPESGGRAPALAFGPDGSLLATTGTAGVRLWQVADPAHPRPAGPPLDVAGGTVNQLLFGRDGRTLLALGGTPDSGDGGEGLVLGWSTDDPAHPVPLTLPAVRPRYPVATALLGPDGRTLATQDGADVQLWDLAGTAGTAAPVSRFQVRGPILALSPERGFLVTGGENNQLEFWNIQDPRHPNNLLTAQPLSGRTSTIRSAAFDGSGQLLAVAHGNGAVSLWNLSNPYYPSLVTELPTVSSYPADRVFFTPDGHTLAARDDSGAVVLWSVPPTLLPGGGPVAFSADGRRLATSNGISNSLLWDLADPRRPTRLGSPRTGAPQPASALAFSPDGRTLALGSPAAGGTGGAIWLTDVTDPGRPVPLGRPLGGPATSVSALAYGPDGRFLVALGDEGRLFLWDVADPLAPAPLGPPLAVPSRTLTGLALSRDGHTLAAGDTTGGVHRWDVTDPRRPVALGAPLAGPASAVNGLAFSPDGRRLAAAHQDGSVRLWATEGTAGAGNTGGAAGGDSAGETLTGPQGAATSVAFGPDGRLLAVGGGDGTARLWRLAPRQPPVAVGRPLTGPVGSVDSVAFGPDGRTLAVSGVDATVRLWDLDATAAVERICATTDGALDEARWKLLVPGSDPPPRPCPVSAARSAALDRRR
ncbi:hypothetical protein ACFVUY_11400 [Kitasatospora sp. NPDC058063]|uniref:nSTAND1 domain-containing NTPase n=1 Tax=unclassified Kitasatospora TaxID=2633591 RepID=UPI0036D7E3B6